MNSSFTSALRPAALATGPVTGVALALLIAAIALVGDDGVALATSPLAVGSSVAAMAGLVMLALGLFRMTSTLPTLSTGLGRTATVVAMVGTVLAAGGEWSLVFVVPGLAEPAPELVQSGIPLVQAGYIASFIVLAIGWLLVAVALMRSGSVPRKYAVLLLIASLLCIVPLPARFVFIAAMVTALEVRAGKAALAHRTDAVMVG